ncbi:flippase-like domain-containing protein [bacterium]|nr:flippase-like domain-containing protein [bacterium]
MQGSSSSQDRAPDIRKGIRSLLLFAVPSLLVVVLSSLRGRDVGSVVRAMDWRYVGAMAVLAAAKWAVDGLRLYVLVMMVGHYVSFWRSFFIELASIFGANITPFYSGGLATQIFFLTDASVSLGQASAVGVAYSILNLAANLVLSVAVLLVPSPIGAGLRRTATVGLAGIMGICAVLIFLGARHPDRAENLLRRLLHGKGRIADRVTSVLGEFSEGMKALMSSKGASVLGLVAVSFVSQVMSLSFTPLAFQALRVPYRSLVETLLLQASVQFSSSAGATPGGIGILEAVFAFFFAPLAGNETATLTLLWRLGTFYIPTMTGALAFMWLLRWHKRNEAAASRTPLPDSDPTS